MYRHAGLQPLFQGANRKNAHFNFLSKPLLRFACLLSVSGAIVAAEYYILQHYGFESLHLI